jgi:hypothetical protein
MNKRKVFVVGAVIGIVAGVAAGISKVIANKQVEEKKTWDKPGRDWEV